MVPDALVPVVIVVAIIAIVRGDASVRDVVRVGKTILTVAVIGLTILYVPSWLYESLFDRDAPTWLTFATALPVLILAFITHLMLTIPRNTQSRPPGTTTSEE